ncbi:hypothetical protein KIW84_UN0919 [Lathyrus oleraceus]|nr:hypothetical protein KIW84_UN0919 [Pisum sativum]
MCKCRSHGTFPLFGLQSSHLNIGYYHQDLQRRPLRPGSRPGFFQRPRAPPTHQGLALAPTAGAQLGTVTQLPGSSRIAQFCLPKRPLGALDSMAWSTEQPTPVLYPEGNFGEPATRRFDLVFRPYTQSDERFARQYRCGPPPRVSSGFAPLRGA